MDKSSLEESCRLISQNMETTANRSDFNHTTHVFNKVSSPSLLTHRSSSTTSTPITSGNSLPKSIQTKRVSDIHPSVITSPFTCGESFFEEDAPLTQSHASYISTVSRKSPMQNMHLQSPLGSRLSDLVQTKENTFASSVFNFNKSAVNMKTKTSEYEGDENENSQQQFMDNDYDFGYKITENVSSSKGNNSAKPVIEDNTDYNTNFSDDDMFAIEDFDEEFSEEMNLPTLETPNRQSKAGI